MSDSTRVAAWLALLAIGLFPVPGRAYEAVAVAAGWFHTCAITPLGGLECWGDNRAGQLGDGTKDSRSLPGAVANLGSGVLAVTAGNDHTCAITTESGVMCWGKNSGFQLGNGSPSESLVPTPTFGLASGVDAISAGNAHNCALSSGLLECWGNNNAGQLGDNNAPNAASTPVEVEGLSSGVAAVSAGTAFTCAIKTGGALECWGDNFHNQLGDGTTTQRNVPNPVFDLDSGVTAVAAGNQHTCAVLGGESLCWGEGSLGQLGTGSQADESTPAAVATLASNTETVAAGRSFTCWLKTNGGVVCAGANGLGSLGDGTGELSSVPVAVVGLGSGVAQIATGFEHACAITDENQLSCWGGNSLGQLGDGTTDPAFEPIGVPEPALPGLYAAALLSLAGLARVRGRSPFCARL